MKLALRFLLQTSAIFYFLSHQSFATTTTISTTVTTGQTLSGGDQLIIASGGHLSTPSGVSTAVFASGSNSTIVLNEGATGITAANADNAAIFTNFSAGSIASVTLNGGSIIGAAPSVMSFNAGGVTTINLNSASTAITSTSSNSSATVIRMMNDPSSSLTINNAGTISGNSGDAVSGFTAFNIGAATLTVNNSGTINVGQTNGSVFSINNGGNATISNTGTITAKISASTYTTSVTNNSSSGINGAISATTGDLDITNTAGTINGNVTLGSNASSTLAINGGTVSGNVTMNNASQTLTLGGGTLSGTVNGAGQIVVSANSTLSSNVGASTAVTSIGVNSGRTLTVDTATISATNTNVTGQLDFARSATITGDVTLIGSSSGIRTGGTSQTISGNFTTASGSTITTSIHSASSADLITVSGLASLDANTKLYVTLSGSTAAGSSYTILSGGSGSSISQISDANINVDGSGTNTSGTYIFTTSTSGNNLILSVTSTAPTLTDSSAQSIYNSIGSSPTGSLLTFKNYVDSLSSEQADQTLKTAAPQTDNSSNRNAMSVTSASLSTVDTRIAEVFNNDSAQFAAAKESDVKRKLGFTTSDVFAYEDKEEKTRGMWVKAFGSAASQSNTKTDGQGFKSNSGGLAFGADTKIDDETVVGVSFSFANSTIKSSDSLKKTFVDTYQLNLYGGKTFGDYYTSAILGYAFNHYTSSRAIPSVSQYAGAKYNGQTYVGMIKGGRNFALDKGFRLSPELTVTAANNNVNNYNESGAGTMNLHVNNSSANFFETRAGVIFDYTTLTANKTKIRPALKLSYGYDWVGAKQSSTASFVNQTSSFSSQGSKVSKRSIKMGAGLDVFRVDNVTLGLEYTYEYRYNYFAHSGSLQGRYNF